MSKTNLTVDTLIFAGFLAAFEPGLTGVAVHEWLSLALAGTLLVHLLLHWEWVVKVTVQFFRKLWHSSRLNYLVDLALLLSMVTVMLSGLLISHSVLPALGLQAAEAPAWRFLHSSSANLSLLLVALHFALHWKWLVNAVRRYLLDPLQKLLMPRNLRPAPAPVRSRK